MSRNVSQKWKETAPDATQWVTVVEYSNDGGQNWSAPASVYSGSTVSADSTQRVRWQCNLALSGWDVGVGGLQPYNSRIRVRHGKSYGTGTPELLGMGTYRVDTVTRSLINPARFTVQGGSFESYLIDAPFSSVRNLSGEMARQRLRSLVHEILPGVTIAWHAEVEDVWLPATTAEGSRWDLIDGGHESASIARALGARVYVDGDNVWHVAPVPSIHNDHVWTAEQGPGGVLLSSAETLTSDEVYNIVIAVGESVDGTVTKEGVARDLDENSPTYVRRPISEGGFGPRLLRYQSNLIRSDGQAQRVAQSQLEPYLGLKQQFEFDQLHDPTKEPDDVGLVDTPSGPHKAILDSATYRLDGGRLTGRTRTTRTDLGAQANGVLS